MARLRIRLNWPRLRENLSREEARAVDDEAVRRWLTDAGFTRDPGTNAWLVDEPDLGHLGPSEVISVEDA